MGVEKLSGDVEAAINRVDQLLFEEKEDLEGVCEIIIRSPPEYHHPLAQHLFSRWEEGLITADIFRAACQEGYLALFELLKDHPGAEVGERDEGGQTHLMAAISSGRIEIVRRLRGHPLIAPHLSEAAEFAKDMEIMGGCWKEISQMLNPPPAPPSVPQVRPAEALRWYYHEVFPGDLLARYFEDCGLKHIEISIGEKQGDEEFFRRNLSLVYLTEIKHLPPPTRIDVGGSTDRPPCGMVPPGCDGWTVYAHPLVADADLVARERLAEDWEGVIMAAVARCQENFELWFRPPRRARILFSGGKGFHVWFPQDPYTLYLTKEVREGFLIQLGKDTGVTFDLPVSTNPTHLIRMPFSVHSTSLRVVAPLCLGDTLRDHPSITEVFAAGSEARQAFAKKIREQALEFTRIS